MNVTFEPTTQEEAIEQIAIGVHTGLRKGVDGRGSAEAWQAIGNMEDGAWSDAVRFCVEGLEMMGFFLCKRTEASDRVAGHWRRRFVPEGTEKAHFDASTNRWYVNDWIQGYKR